MKLAISFVLYNPLPEVFERIKCYLPFADKMYVFDNSPSASSNIGLINLKNVEYIAFNENKGIGYAINYVSQRAFCDGFRWLLYMDQDSDFVEGWDGFKKMLFAFENQNDYSKEKTGIISPIIVYEGENKEYIGRNEFERILITINSGSLINLDVFKKLGGLREDYFLDRIDFEYCLRLNKNGYYVLRYHNTFLKHRLGNLKVYSLFGLKIRVTNHSAFRHYYMTKNALDIVKNYLFIFPSHCLYELKSIISDVIKIIFFEKDKIEKIKMVIRGVIDSL